jgi:hypothetical protein
MPTFSDITTVPAQQYYDDPEYLTGSAAKWASLLGFKKTGQRNTWGKIAGTFNPLFGIASNKVVDKIAADSGAGTAQENVKDVFQGDLLKAKVGLQAGLVAAGAMAGSPQAGMAASGLVDKAIPTTPNGGGTQTATGAIGANGQPATQNMTKTDPTTGQPMQGGGGFDYMSTIENGIPVVSSIIDGIVNRRRYGANMANDSKTNFFYRYKKGGKAKCEDGGKIGLYSEEDDTEDVNMVDKKTGQKVGEMRYGERIFSQKDTIVIEELADKGMFSALGEFTAMVIKEQDHESDPADEAEDKKEEGMSEANDNKEDMAEMEMMYGGKTKRRKFSFATGGLFTDPTIPPRKSGIKKVMQGYNPSQELYSTLGYTAFVDEVNKLTVDEKAQALNAYLPKVKTAQERQLLMSALNDKDPYLDLAGEYVYGPVHDAIYGYIKSKKGTPAANQPTGTPNQQQGTNPVTGLPYVVLGSGVPDGTSTTETTADIFSNMDSIDTGMQTKKRKPSVSDILGYGSDALGAITGLTGANQELPEWQLPSDWRMNYNELRQMRNQGLTEEEKSYAADMTDTTYAADVANIANITAAGGNAGQVLANTRGAATSRYRNNQQTLSADVQQRRQNRALFSDTLRQDISYDRQIFEDEYTQAANSINTYATLAEQSLQNMADRADYNKMYGEGSAYDQLMQLQVENAGLQNQRLRRSLTTKGVNPIQSDAISKPVTDNALLTDENGFMPPTATDNTFMGQSVELTPTPVQETTTTETTPANSEIPTIKMTDGVLDLSDQSSFSKAFAEAKKQLGEGELFVYKGKKYTVKTK